MSFPEHGISFGADGKSEPTWFNVLRRLMRWFTLDQSLVAQGFSLRASRRLPAP